MDSLAFQLWGALQGCSEGEVIPLIHDRYDQKHPGIAAVLSFFITGLGQIYNGQIGKGILGALGYFVCWGLTAILIGWVLLLPLWIWGIFDAYRTAERINAGSLIP